MEKGELPIDFINQMANILDESELAAFISSVTSTSSVTGIRFNPLKASGLNKSGTVIPWTQRGFTLENRPNFTLDPSFHAGAYYVQDPSSMFVEWVAKKLLNTTKTPYILDLAAAPGGKSTILAEIAYEKNGFLLANEVIKSRVPILKQNLAKWGYANVFVSSFEVPVFSSLPPIFDLILLDAPCSGEGLFRKEVKARDEWSLEHVNHCASRQKRILSPIPALLKEGGFLIYSTCTYNTQENDDQIAWLCQTFSLEIVPMEVPSQWGLLNTEKGGFQCFPHRVKGEGFYLAVLQKIGSAERNTSTEIAKRNVKVPRKRINFPDALSSFLKEDNQLIGVQDNSGNYYGIPENLFSEFNLISQYLPFIDPILLLGAAKGHDFIPEQELALSTYVNEEVPHWELERYEALLYLKKEVSHSAPPNVGWGKMSYNGLSMGWYKAMGHRYNNYFPKHWRIIMSLPPISHLPELPFLTKLT